MRRTIHLVNPLIDANGGSEWRTVSLWQSLAPHAEVQVWSEFDIHPRLAELCPAARRIDSAAGVFPRGGTLVMLGVYFTHGAWLAACRPERAIVVYNTPAPSQLRRTLNSLGAAGIRRVELVYASALLKEHAKLPGRIELSPIDLERFVPAARAPAAGRLVLGRLSRDVAFKHHPADLAFYARLAEAGCTVRVMGGTCLRAQGKPAAGVELLPAGAEPAEKFLQSIDCFFYRTAAHWTEVYGRVVFEAMACGAVVVGEARHGYAAHIENGRTGFVSEREEDLLAAILRLRDEPALRAGVAAAARAAVGKMYSPEQKRAALEYYLR
jgi:glycosyltransferase involved in cell wall biosynthesis